MSFRAVLKFVVFFLIALSPLALRAQQVGATVHGTVADPESAVIPGATVTLTPASGKALVTQSQSDGTYTLRGVGAGTYSMTVTMKGFASFVKLGVKVAAGQNLALDAKMAIEEEKQEVNVNSQGAQVSVDSDSNASSTVIKGKDLDALSDDPDELSSELTALAGPAAGPSGGQIYVDGFTGGQLPPKSSIREIRINQNPFRRSMTSWDTDALRFLRSRVRISITATSACRVGIMYSIRRTRFWEPRIHSRRITRRSF
jgi:hypothetical protein